MRPFSGGAKATAAFLTAQLPAAAGTRKRGKDPLARNIADPDDRPAKHAVRS